jgi:hypothetical protein
MLAKLTSKNQLTLPKSVVEATGKAEYFEVEARNGQLVLTPVRIQRADAVRAKLAELDLGDNELTAAVAWARGITQSRHPHAVHEDAAPYDQASKRKTKSARRRRK